MVVTATPSGTISYDALLGALNLSSEAIIVYEPVRDDGAVTDLKVTIMNDAAAQLCRVARELSIGMDYQMLWKMDKEGFIWMKFLDALYTDIPQRYEWEIYCGGETKWYDVGLQTFSGYIAASYHDITERKRHLIAEQAQRRFYENMLDNGNSRRTLLRPVRDNNGNIQDFQYDYVNYGAGINDEHRNLANLSMVRQGALLTDLFPSIRDNELWRFMAALANDGVMSQMIVHYNRDGINVEGELTGQLLQDGRILLEHTALGFVQELIARLQSKKDDFEALLEAAPVGLSIFVAVYGNSGEVKDFKLTRCNSLAARLSKLPTELYVPGMVYGLTMLRNQRRDLAKLIETFLNGRIHEEEMFQPQMRKWISFRLIPFKDGLISVMQDITELKDARIDKEAIAA